MRELMPGDVALGLVGDQLKTLLGSCVSVILTDPRRTVGVMSHIVHVGIANAANQGNTAYGDPAMQAMFKLLLARGVAPTLCEAYVDPPTKRAVVDRVLEHLRPGGLFFLGTAEGRVPCDTPLTALQPGAFRKTV